MCVWVGVSVGGGVRVAKSCPAELHPFLFRCIQQPTSVGRNRDWNTCVSYLVHRFTHVCAHTRAPTHTRAHAHANKRKWLELNEKLYFLFVLDSSSNRWHKFVILSLPFLLEFSIASSVTLFLCVE